MIHEEELSASRSHSRQKVKYLMEYLGSKYVDVEDKTFANAPPVMRTHIINQSSLMFSFGFRS